MKRVTISQIEARLDHLNEMLGLPLEPCYRDADGKLKWHEGVFIWSGAYGGYKFERITCDKGGVSNPTGMGYVSKRECLERLNTFILGLDIEKKPIPEIIVQGGVVVDVLGLDEYTITDLDCEASHD